MWFVVVCSVLCVDCCALLVVVCSLCDVRCGVFVACCVLLCVVHWSFVIRCSFFLVVVCCLLFDGFDGCSLFGVVGYRLFVCC